MNTQVRKRGEGEEFKEELKSHQIITIIYNLWREMERKRRIASLTGSLIKAKDEYTERHLQEEEEEEREGDGRKRRAA